MTDNDNTDNIEDFAETSKDEGLPDEPSPLDDTAPPEAPAQNIDMTPLEVARILDPKGVDADSLADRIKELSQSRDMSYSVPIGVPEKEGDVLVPRKEPLVVSLQEPIIKMRTFNALASGKQTPIDERLTAKAILNVVTAQGKNAFESEMKVLDPALAGADYPCYKSGIKPASSLSRFLSTVTIVGASQEPMALNLKLLGGTVLVPGEPINGDPMTLTLADAGRGLIEEPTSVLTPDQLGKCAVVLTRSGDQSVPMMCLVRSVVVSADDLLGQYRLLKQSQSDPTARAKIVELENLLVAAGATKNKIFHTYRYDVLSKTERSMFSTYLSSTEGGKRIVDSIVYRATDFGNAVPLHVHTCTTINNVKFVVDYIVPRAPLVPSEVVQLWCVKGRIDPTKTRGKVPRRTYDDQTLINTFIGTNYPVAAVAPVQNNVIIAPTSKATSVTTVAPPPTPTTPAVAAPPPPPVAAVAAAAAAAAAAVPPTTAVTPQPRRTKQTARAPATNNVVAAVPASPKAVAAGAVAAPPPPVVPEATPTPAAVDPKKEEKSDPKYGMITLDDTTGDATVTPAPTTTGRKRANSKSAAATPTADGATHAEPTAKKSRSAPPAQQGPPSAIPKAVMPSGPRKTLQGSVAEMFEQASKALAPGGKAKEIRGAFENAGPGPLLEPSKEHKTMVGTAVKFGNIFGPIGVARIKEVIMDLAAAAEIAAADTAAPETVDDEDWG